MTPSTSGHGTVRDDRHPTRDELRALALGLSDPAAIFRIAGTAREVLRKARSSPECREQAREACALLLPSRFVHVDPFAPSQGCPDEPSGRGDAGHVATCAWCRRIRLEELLAVRPDKYAVASYLKKAGSLAQIGGRATLAKAQGDDDRRAPRWEFPSADELHDVHVEWLADEVSLRIRAAASRRRLIAWAGDRLVAVPLELDASGTAVGTLRLVEISNDAVHLFDESIHDHFVSVVRNLRGDHTIEERRHAMAMIADLGAAPGDHADVWEALAPLLKPDDDLAPSVARLVGELECHEALDTLRALLGDAAGPLREAAADAIERIETEL